MEFLSTIRPAAALLLLATLARAQIVEVELRDEKAVRAQDKYLLERDGRVFLLGEARWALPRDSAGRPTIPKEPLYQLELFVADPEQPEEVPYTWKDDDAREPRWKAREAVLPGKDLVAIRMITGELTLENLAAEVRERRARIATLERQRAGRPRASEAWFHAHYLLLETHRRLQILVEQNGFEPAARAMDAELARLAKEAERDPRFARGQEALASIRRLEPTARLVEVAQAVSEGQHVFTLHESRHLRLVCDERTSEPEARALLAFGEEIIEGFRREFVDPYSFPDLIPARVFAEFWYGPDAPEDYGRYYEEYYGLSFGTPEERSEALAGHGRLITYGEPRVFLAYYKRAELDLPRPFAHRLGDVLASIHFMASLRDGHLPRMAWLQEAGGVETVFQYRGVYSGTCFSLRKDSASRDVARARRWNERPVAHQLALARECPRPIAQVVLRDLLELGDADLAKGWSLFRFFAAEGESGQAALHAAARLAREPATFTVRWREELGRLYPVKAGEDPLDALEDRWRASLPPGEAR